MITMIEEDWGLWTYKEESLETIMRSHIERISNYSPPTQCDGTFWGELINIDILKKTKNKSVPLD